MLAHQAKLNNLAAAKVDVKVEDAPFTVMQIHTYLKNLANEREQQKAIDVESEELGIEKDNDG